MRLLLLLGVCLCAVIPSVLSLSEDCRRDWNHYQVAILSEEWAQRSQLCAISLILDSSAWYSTDLNDSTGLKESGTWNGNYVFEGDYQQCIQASENQTVPNPVEGLYCMGTWNSYILGPLFTRGLGYCLPHRCNDTDALELLHRLQTGVKDNVRINCVRKRDLSSDPGAIVSITILSIFGAIVLTATLFDVFYQYMNERRRKVMSKDTETGNTHTGHVNGGLDIGSQQSGDNSQGGDKGVNTVTREYIEIGNVNGGVNDGSGDMPVRKGSVNGSVNGSVKESVKGSVNGSVNGDISNINASPTKHQFKQPPVDVSVPANWNKQYNLIRKSKQDNKPSIPTRLLLSFSLWTNVPPLVSAKHHPGSFQCLHGIRFLTMAWIILGHTYQLGTYLTEAATVSNRWQMTDSLNRYAHQAINEMWLAVETFFLMSAMLTTVSFMKTIKRQGNKVTCRQMALYYFHRYWRLTPVYMIILMVWVNLYYYFGAGPFFKEISGIENCKVIWWRHLLYIQNLFPKYIDCFGWSWYLANDFQYYLVAPLFLVVTYFFPVPGVIFMCCGYGGSLIANVVLYDQLYKGVITDQFSYIYVRPWTRATTYFLGMLLGYTIFRTLGKKIKIHKVLVVLGWTLAFCLLNIAIYVTRRSGNFSGAGYTIFKSLQTTMFALAVMWIIFTCIHGYGGIFNIILSWKFWIPLSRLTYTGYLIHPIFVYYFVYSCPKQIYYYDWLMIYLYFGNLVMTLLASFMVTLVFEIPMLGLEKVLIPKQKKS